jgi:hypothetical protein
MKRLALVTAVLAALAVPATASAGGLAAFALQGPGARIQAGELWVAQIRVVSCMGQLSDLGAPSLTIMDGAGDVRTFRTQRAGAAGRYTARVVFPSAGDWSYRVNLATWRGETHGPFKVAPKKTQPSRLLAALPPVGAVLLVLGTGLAVRRRNR